MKQHNHAKRVPNVTCVNTLKKMYQYCSVM